MGGVIIESFNAQLGGAGGLAGTTLWTDTFAVGNPARNISVVRADYAFMIHAGAGVSNGNPCDNAPSISAVNSGLRFTGNGSAQPITANWVPVKAPGIWGRSQFVEAVIAINAANSTIRGGFGLMNTADHRGGAGGFIANYELAYVPNTPAIGINQIVNSTVTNLATLAGPVPVNSSKVAFAADYEITPGSVRLTVWDDEVLILDVTDATPQPQQGLPSMMTSNCTVGTFMDFTSLRMGTLGHLEYYV